MVEGPYGSYTEHTYRSAVALIDEGGRPRWSQSFDGAMGEELWAAYPGDAGWVALAVRGASQLVGPDGHRIRLEPEAVLVGGPFEGFAPVQWWEDGVYTPDRVGWVDPGGPELHGRRGLWVPWVAGHRYLLIDGEAPDHLRIEEPGGPRPTRSFQGARRRGRSVGLVGH